jgi:HPt (histidine-containing phosphotransfer) domain-containing protein
VDEASQKSFLAQLETARTEFGQLLPGRVAEIQALVSSASWQEARRAALRLRGSAATYGFPALGTAAGDIEDVLLASGSADGDPDAASLARIADRLQVAAALADHAAHEDR